MADEDEIEDESLDAIAPDETPDASDPKTIQRQKQKRKHADDIRGDFWRAVLALETGRMVLWEFLTACGTFEERFAATPAGFPDPNATWYHLGQKNIGERLYKTLMKHDHDMVYEMHKTFDPEMMEAKPPKRQTRNNDAF